MLRIAFLSLLLGASAELVAYFWIGAAAGDGESLFRLTAAVAAFFACGAATCLTWRWLRLLLAVGSLCALALLVDQLAYFEWHDRVDRFVTSAKREIEPGSPDPARPMTVRPTHSSIDPDRSLVLTFEPPLLAWTYHLDSASSLGHTLASGWYRLLSSLPRGADIDPIARIMIRPHEARSVGVVPCETMSACKAGGGGHWAMYIDASSGYRSP